jgi:HSP20 family protein
MMRRMQTDMDRLFNQLVQPATQEIQRMEQSWAPSVDISHDDKEWLIEAELPGVDKDHIEVEVRQGQLMFRAEMRHEQRQEAQPQAEGGKPEGNGNGQRQEGSRERQYHHRERRYGFFERVLPLPENVNEEQIHCEFRDGVLKIHLPKTAEQKPRERRIPISAGDQQAPAAVTAGGQPATSPMRSEQSHQSAPESGEAKPKMATAGSKGGQRSSKSRAVNQS